MLKKIIKIKVLKGFDSFLCYLTAKTYGFICLAGSRKFVHSVFIWEQDSALKWLCFRVISCGINEGPALKCSLLPFQHCFMVYIMEILKDWWFCWLIPPRTHFPHFEGMLTNYALVQIAVLRQALGFGVLWNIHIYIYVYILYTCIYIYMYIIIIYTCVYIYIHVIFSI